MSAHQSVGPGLFLDALERWAQAVRRCNVRDILFYGRDVRSAVDLIVLEPSSRARLKELIDGAPKTDDAENIFQHVLEVVAESQCGLPIKTDADLTALSTSNSNGSISN